MSSTASEPGRWSKSKHSIRRGPGTLYRKLQSLKFLLTRDHLAVARFLRAEYPAPLSIRARLDLLSRYMTITHAVRGYHTLAEILTTTDAILQRPGAIVVEAGCGSGASTAKLSLATKLVGGQLHVFDSFQGIPANDELHHLLDGTPLRFRQGAFRGRLTAVQRRVAELGAIDVCSFHKGLFEDTMPGVGVQPDVILLDVDLRSSSVTCLRHLVPKLTGRGIVFSQDGHIREIRDLFQDPSFWRKTVGIEPPSVDATRKLLVVRPRATKRAARNDADG